MKMFRKIYGINIFDFLYDQVPNFMKFQVESESKSMSGFIQLPKPDVSWTPSIGVVAGLTIRIVSQTNVLCHGGSTGSLEASGRGGVAPYQYKKNSGAYGDSGIFSSLSAGDYDISVRDSERTVTTQTITITQPSALSGSITSQTNVTIHGGNNGSVTVAGSGGTSPYTYALDAGSYGSSGTFSGLAAGNYTVHVKDANNCVADVPVTITENLLVLHLVFAKAIDNMTIVLGFDDDIDFTTFPPDIGSFNINTSSEDAVGIDNISTYEGNPPWMILNLAGRVGKDDVLSIDIPVKSIFNDDYTSTNPQYTAYSIENLISE